MEGAPSKRPRSNSLNEKPVKKRQTKKKDAPAEDKSTEELIREVDNWLKKYKERLAEKNIKCSVEAEELKTLEDMQQAKTILEEEGFIIIRKAISKLSALEARKNVGECICDLWQEVLKDKEGVKKQLRAGNLHVFQQFRNTSSGHGNASFGYYYKQFLNTSEYPTLNLQGDTISFDHNPIHAKVNLELISHADNLHSLAILLGLTHVDGMVSWDSVKFATNPKPKPKTMTKQTLTQLHIDHYSSSINRYQAIDNLDGAVKLFFVPGTNCEEVQQLFCRIAKKQLFKEQGYKQIHNIDKRLTEVLWKHAIAPPPFARVIWKSGTVHFEGQACDRPLPEEDPFSLCFSCVGLKDVPNAQRFRFVIGTHKSLLTQTSLQKLAIAAERGLCPAVYASINRNTCVDTNIVNRKSTQWKIPRTITTQELDYLRGKLDGLSIDDETALSELLKEEIPSPTKRLLYGIKEPIESLSFHDNDKAILRELANRTQQ